MKKMFSLEDTSEKFIENMNLLDKRIGNIDKRIDNLKNSKVQVKGTGGIVEIDYCEIQNLLDLIAKMKTKNKKASRIIAKYIKENKKLEQAIIGYENSNGKLDLENNNLIKKTRALENKADNLGLENKRLKELLDNSHRGGHWGDDLVDSMQGAFNMFPDLHIKGIYSEAEKATLQNIKKESEVIENIILEHDLDPKSIEKLECDGKFIGIIGYKKEKPKLIEKGLFKGREYPNVVVDPIEYAVTQIVNEILETIPEDEMEDISIVVLKGGTG